MATLSLGNIERSIRQIDHPFAVVTGRGEVRDTETGPGRDRSVRVIYVDAGIVEAMAQAPGETDSSIQVRIRQEDRELVPTEPGDDVGAAHGGQEGLSDFLEQEISYRVTVGVVDLLEIIEIQENQGQRSPSPLRGPGLFVQEGFQGSPVVEVREGIMEREGQCGRVELGVACGNPGGGGDIPQGGTGPLGLEVIEEVLVRDSDPAEDFALVLDWYGEQGGERCPRRPWLRVFAWLSISMRLHAAPLEADEYGVMGEFPLEDLEYRLFHLHGIQAAHEFEQ